MRSPCLSRPPGNGPARTDPQRPPRVVSIHLPSLALVEALDQRDLPPVESSGRACEVLTYRDHPATAQRGPAPASAWSGLDTPPLASARGGTRPAVGSAGRVAARATKERRGCVSRPPGNSPARPGSQRLPRVVSIRPKHAPSSRLRPTRPAERFAGRVAGTSLRSPCVSRPPANGSAWTDPQRLLGAVSIRPTELLRRRPAYSTIGTPYSPPLWSDWPRASWAFSTAAFIWLIRRWYSARSPASRAFWAAE